MAKSKTVNDAKAAAAAAGIDWNTLMQLVMSQGIPFIMALIQAFQKKATATRTVKASADECAADVAAHFEAIIALAECGISCAGGE